MFLCRNHDLFLFIILLVRRMEVLQVDVMLGVKLPGMNSTFWKQSDACNKLGNLLVKKQQCQHSGRALFKMARQYLCCVTKGRSNSSNTILNYVKCNILCGHISKQKWDILSTY